MKYRAKLHTPTIVGAAGAAGALALVVLLGGPIPPASAAPPVVSTAPLPGEIVVVDAGEPSSIPLAGSGESGEEIVAWASVDGDQHALCSAVVEPDGTWSCVAVEAPDFRGPVTFTNGVETLQLDFGLIHAPSLTTDEGDPSSLTSTQTFDDPTQLLEGTGVPGAIVTVELNGGSGCSATVDADARWSCTLTALPTGAGPYTISVGQAYADAPAQRAFAAPVAFLVGGTTIIGPVVPTPPDPPAPVVPVPPAPGVPDPAPAAPAPPATGGSGGGGGAAAVGGDGTGSGSVGSSDRRDAGPAGSGSSETAEAAGGSNGTRGPSGTGAGAQGGGSGSAGATGATGASSASSAETQQNGGARAGEGHDERVRGSHGFKMLGRADRAGRAGETGAEHFRVGGAEVGAVGVRDSSAGRAEAADSKVLDGSGRSGRGSGAASGAESAAGDRALDDTVVADGVPAVPSLLERGVEPSEFSLSLVTVGEVVSRGPASVVVLGALIAGAMLLVIVPGGLLESTLHDNLPRLRRSRVAQALLGATRRPRHGRAPRSPRMRSAVGIGSVVALGALASVAVSPSAAFDPPTVRLFLAFLLASVVVSGVTLGVSAFYARRVWGIRAVPYARPTVLTLTVVSVVVSRVVGLEPGFVFGAVIALQFGAALGNRRSARRIVVSTAALLALGVSAWMAQSALRADAVAHPDAFSALLLDTVTAVTVGALSGPIVSLLPLRFLDGQSLYTQTKAGWAALYAVSAAVFGFVLLPLPDAWSTVGGDQLLWFVALAAFATLSLAVWAWFRFVPERSTRREANPAHDRVPTSIGR